MSENMPITEEMLDSLRNSLIDANLCGEISDKRLRHILEVEKMAARLGELYVPEKIPVLRAAALLHDITKERSFDEQIKLCAEYDIKIGENEYYAAKTLHAMTGAKIISKLYPEFDTDEICECVRWHTTGKPEMSLCEKLIYLADYIDMSRTFEDCVALRKIFFGVDILSMNSQQKKEHLDDTLLISYDMTIKGLLEKGTPISIDTISARNELAVKKIKRRI